MAARVARLRDRAVFPFFIVFASWFLAQSALVYTAGPYSEPLRPTVGKLSSFTTPNRSARATFSFVSRAKRSKNLGVVARFPSLLLILLPVALLCVLASETHNPPFGKWTRISSAPVVFPRGNGFESAGTFNPSVIMDNGKFVMLYRAQDRQGKSSLGFATSGDGVYFTRKAEPVFVSEAPYEKGGGVEDPRLVKVGDTFYLTYTGFNNVDGMGVDKHDAQLCLATSKDLIHWERQGVILPSYKGSWNVKWTKSGAILTEKINGKYWMYFLGDAKNQDAQMGLAYSDDLLHWTEALDHPVLSSRAGKFDSQVVEPGPPPIVTPEGIFLIYNGADDHNVYSVGWVLFDKDDPTKVIVRADFPIFYPELEWEKVGQVPNVVFVEGMIREKERWLFFYGAADKYVGVASAPVQ